MSDPLVDEAHLPLNIFDQADKSFAQYLQSMYAIAYCTTVHATHTPTHAFHWNLTSAFRKRVSALFLTQALRTLRVANKQKSVGEACNLKLEHNTRVVRNACLRDIAAVVRNVCVAWSALLNATRVQSATRVRARWASTLLRTSMRAEMH